MTNINDTQKILKKTYFLQALIDEINIFLDESIARGIQDLSVLGDQIHIDERTALYYRSIQLFQKPVNYENKQAVYGYFNFIQIALIKYFQSHKYTLNRIQASKLLESEDRAIEAFQNLYQVQLVIEGSDQKPNLGQVLAEQWIGQRKNNDFIEEASPWKAVEIAPKFLISFDSSLYTDASNLIYLMKNALKYYLDQQQK